VDRPPATLIETTDADFEWMIHSSRMSDRGLTLPPGGVDANDVLIHVRGIARSLYDRQGHSDNWMIVADREVVGLCGYKHPPSADGGVDIGYSIAPSRRRCGHATRAVAAILVKSRADSRVSYIIAETALDNHASQRVLTTNGFQCMGRAVDPDDGEPLFRWRITLRA
jgi:RimJ/RimL family protein N-acetyltransferase